MIFFEDELYHYGTKRHSGRYPFGSGEDPYQHDRDFLSRIKNLRDSGMSDTEIANDLNMSTTDFRSRVTFSKAKITADNAHRAFTLKEKGWSNIAIGERLGVSEATVRNLLDPSKNQRAKETLALSDALKESVDEHNYVDVGIGTERLMGVKRTRMIAAIQNLEDQGYNLNEIKTTQVGTGNKTTLLVLSKPGIDKKEVSANRASIYIPDSYTEDGGVSFVKKETPKSIDSSRVSINYAEDGGKEKDGVIELRRGVDDISLGNARYAQVRILVDGTHYIKGMAMYSDDLPNGVDIRFNTNKHKDTPMMGSKDNTVLKPVSGDEDNPFGATIRRDNELIRAQRHYKDSDGNTQLSALNIVGEEGNWETWSKTLSSQFLSKQRPELIKRQLSLAYEDRETDYNEIMSLTNPSVKKKMLLEFADECDSAAVHLKAAALPRQASHVILPFNDISENEVYAPNYKDGEKVVLVRHPHAGLFELPELTVNNKSQSAKKTIGNAIDAIGINHKVAEQLSGADFDGDTVIVIPNNKNLVKTQRAVKSLADFDPKAEYPAYDGMLRVGKDVTDKNGNVEKGDHFRKGIEMGKISNLITDMTIREADPDEIVRAVKHSMVVIDAEKHQLNWKLSEQENDIKSLKKKYQFHVDDDGYGGASTLISKAKSTQYVLDRQEGQYRTDPVTGKTKKYYIDPSTGEKLYTPTGKMAVKRHKLEDGTIVFEQTNNLKMIKSTKMAEAKDAMDLSSGSIQENLYADYANKLKALGNKARLDYLNTAPLKKSESAAKVYAKEAESLEAKINLAMMNAPRERKAQVLANSMFAQQQNENPMSYDEAKKVKARNLKIARERVGAKRTKVSISDKEWEAIQSGALAPSKLDLVLRYADSDRVKELALPKEKSKMSSIKIARAKTMEKNGFTQAEIAEMLGVSVSTLRKAIDA